MIAYEILKKNKPVQSYSYPYQQYHQRMGLFERRRIENQSELKKTSVPAFDLGVLKLDNVRMPYTDELVTELRTKGEFHPNPPSTVPIAMGKLQYAQWLNAHVYPHFPKNSLVTFKTIPIVLNAVPEVFFVVREIQELHYWSNVDKETREPKAVGISLPQHTVPAWYPPSVLRRLEPSEITGIDKLRNQTSQGRVREALDDATSVDRSTGEVLSSD